MRTSVRRWALCETIPTGRNYNLAKLKLASPDQTTSGLLSAYRTRTVSAERPVRRSPGRSTYSSPWSASHRWSHPARIAPTRIASSAASWPMCALPPGTKTAAFAADAVSFFVCGERRGVGRGAAGASCIRAYVKRLQKRLGELLHGGGVRAMASSNSTVSSDSPLRIRFSLAVPLLFFSPAIVPTPTCCAHGWQVVVLHVHVACTSSLAEREGERQRSSHRLEGAGPAHRLPRRPPS